MKMTGDLKTYIRQAFDNLGEPEEILIERHTDGYMTKIGCAGVQYVRILKMKKRIEEILERRGYRLHEIVAQFDDELSKGYQIVFDVSKRRVD